MALGKHVGASGYKLFHDNLTAECNLDHPLAKLMADQLAWAHFAIGNLHLRAAGAATEDIRVAMTATAGRLMVEYRKSLTALREFWEPQGPVNTAAESAEENDQPVAVDRSHAATTAVKNAAGIELGSNGARPNGAATNGTFSAPSRRQNQPHETEGHNARRSAKVG